MEIRSFSASLIVQRLEAGDRDGIREVMAALDRQADGWKKLLSGFRLFSAQHRSRPGEIPSIVVIDALADLAPTFRDRPSPRFLDAAISYLLSLPRSSPRIELFAIEEDRVDSPVVPVSLLEDALTCADLSALCSTIERLRRVVSSPEYLHELILDAVAPDSSDDGHPLIQASATVKAIHQIPWEDGRGIVFRLTERLADEPFLPAPMIGELPKPVPCRAGFAESLRLDAPENSWLYLTHAFQVERYAQLRQKGVRWGLRAWIAERLFRGDAEAMDQAEAAFVRATAARRTEIPEEIGEEVGRRIAHGVANDPLAIADQVARSAERLSDVDPLFSWLAEGALDPLETGDPQPIVMVNAARWGAHLLGQDHAGQLSRILMERLAARRSKSAED